MNVLLRNSNRTQVLLTEAQAKKVPALYAQESLGENAKVFLKFFMSSWTWFITELDPVSLEAFGKVFSHMTPEGEMGYISLRELASAKGPYGIGVERDIHFTPCILKDCKNPLLPS